VLLGGWGDEPSSHWLEVVPRRHFPEGATTTVGVTGRARFPGELMEIPQARETAKYITSNYSEYAGFPAPLTNGGLNEHGVAARDVWSPTINRLLDMTPNPQRGPNYSDLARIAMERATTAREAVEIVGGLIDKYGYSTYGGNSHLFADRNEGWVFINYGGGQGLWAAERLGPDEVRVSYPGYLNPFPLDYKNHPEEYLASDNFIDFAVEQGWFDPQGHDTFDSGNLRRLAAERPEGERAGAPRGSRAGIARGHDGLHSRPSLLPRYVRLWPRRTHPPRPLAP
jgi:dipeptidase